MSVKNSFYLFLIVSLVGCTDEGGSKSLLVIAGHEFSLHNRVKFTVEVKNFNRKELYVIDPDGGSVINKVEPVSFCLAKSKDSPKKLPDKFEDAYSEYISKAVFRENQFRKMSAFSFHLLKVPPKGSVKFRNGLMTPDATLPSGRIQVRCYYSMSKLDFESANSLEVEDFMKKMKPLELISDDYYFEIP